MRAVIVQSVEPLDLVSLGAGEGGTDLDLPHVSMEEEGEDEVILGGDWESGSSTTDGSNVIVGANTAEDTTAVGIDSTQGGSSAGGGGGENDKLGSSSGEMMLDPHPHILNLD